MVLFSVRNLVFKDYKWSSYSHTDPRICGVPDSTLFNRTEGNEVTWLINKLMVQWNYRFTNTGNKIERLIHEQLPEGVISQQEVSDWVKGNLKF